MRDYSKVAFERKGYKAAIIIDTDLKTLWKKVRGADVSILGVPVSILFGINVVLIAVGGRYFNDFFINRAPNKKPSPIIMMIPTVVYVGATMLLGAIFKYVAVILVDRENHRE